MSITYATLTTINNAFDALQKDPQGIEFEINPKNPAYGTCYLKSVIPYKSQDGVAKRCLANFIDNDLPERFHFKGPLVNLPAKGSKPSKQTSYGASMNIELDQHPKLKFVAQCINDAFAKWSREVKADPQYDDLAPNDPIKTKYSNKVDECPDEKLRGKEHPATLRFAMKFGQTFAPNHPVKSLQGTKMTIMRGVVEYAEELDSEGKYPEFVVVAYKAKESNNIIIKNKAELAEWSNNRRNITYHKFFWSGITLSNKRISLVPTTNEVHLESSGDSGVAEDDDDVRALIAAKIQNGPAPKKSVSSPTAASISVENHEDDIPVKKTTKKTIASSAKKLVNLPAKKAAPVEEEEEEEEEIDDENSAEESPVEEVPAPPPVKKTVAQKKKVIEEEEEDPADDSSEEVSVKKPTPMKKKPAVVVSDEEPPEEIIAKTPVKKSIRPIKK